MSSRILARSSAAVIAIVELVTQGVRSASKGLVGSLPSPGGTAASAMRARSGDMSSATNIGYQGQKQNDFLETDAKHGLLLLCVQPLELSGKRVPRIGRPARVERGDHA